MMITRGGWKRCIAPALALGLGLVVVDQIDAVSYLRKHGRRHVRSAYLTLRPIQVTDEDLLHELGGRFPSWESHWKARADGTIRSALRISGQRADLIRQLRAAHPTAWERIVKHADRAAADRFAPFDGATVRLGREFDWRSFPPAKDDVLFIWEIGTLQHLPLLAQAYLGSGDSRYLAAITRHHDGWRDQNPIGNSVNWRAAMEVSLRLYALVWTAEFLADDPKAAPVARELTKSILAHARYVYENMHQPRKRNNHHIFTVAGLYLTAVAYPEFAEAAQWRRSAEQQLLEELRVQYSVNGFHKEYAPTYQLALLDCYLQYLVAKRRLGEPVPQDVLAAIQGQVRVTRDLTDPNGHVWLLADSDDHHFIRIVEDQYSDARPTLHLGALLFSMPDMLRATQNAGWESVVLLGQPLHRSLRQSCATAPSRRSVSKPRLAVYPQEGFFRVERDRLTLFGTFAPLKVATQFVGHRHSDLSTFFLSDGATPVVIDAGTYTYRQWVRSQAVVMRDYLRSSFAHNTTSVDGCSQAEPGDEFDFTSSPDARLLFHGTQGPLTVVGGEHQAYAARVGRAVRLFAMTDQALLVVDWFPDAHGFHLYDSRFLFGQPVSMGEGPFATGTFGNLSWPSDTRKTVRRLHGSFSPAGGWASPAYGTLIKAPQISSLQGAVGPTALAFLFDLSAHGRKPAADAVVVKRNSQGTILIQAVTGKRTIRVAINTAASGDRAVLGRVTTDARYLFELEPPVARGILVGGSPEKTTGTTGNPLFVPLTNETVAGAAQVK